MQTPSIDLINGIRSTSREIVRELGFMNRTVAESGLPPSAVHSVLEIGAAGQMTAKDLSERLLLEKSTISRLVKTLVQDGILTETKTAKDARVKFLELTAHGEKTRAMVTQFAENQVTAALTPLNEHSRDVVLEGLEIYATALRTSRLSDNNLSQNIETNLETGYFPGIIGRIVELHGTYYNKRSGFGSVFESEVAEGLGTFFSRLNNPANEIWSVHKGGTIVGSIAIDGEKLGHNTAQIRWFIVDECLRGSGAGNQLMEKAMAFCEKHAFREVHLWTYNGLKAARSLYEKHGFSLAEEHESVRWGPKIQEQKFVKVQSPSISV